MSDEKTMTPIKAVLGFIVNLVLFVIGPMLLIDVYLPEIAPSYAGYITQDMKVYIMTLGAISAVVFFFKNLWKRGTRPHGLFNVIFAIFSTYFLLVLFGGVGNIGSGGFGIFELTISDYTIGIDLTLVAYIIIAQGAISVVLYLYEMIA